MPGQLLVMKQIRPNAKVAFYSAPDFVKEALRTYGPPAVVGERNFADGLVRVRTLLFPTVEDYQNWLTNPVTSGNVKDRFAYNKEHGIIEIHKVFSTGDFDILSLS
jgi:hypothetical protein